MDGLLGDFGNFIKTPEGQGLLSAAFGGLAGARPGQPWNTLGRAGVSGLLGYQNAQENQLTTKLADLKMKSMEDELAEKKRIADFYGNVGQFMPSQASQALAANANAGRAGPTGQFMPEDMPAPQFNANAMYQAMLKSGSPTLAQAGLQGMVKEKPKVKDWQKVNVGGNVLYAPYFEDGTVGQPVPYQVAEKLHFANTGGETVGMDAFTGKKIAAVKNTQSPESVASNALGWANFGLSKQRFSNEVANQSAPQFNAEFGGFITKPTAQNPNGGFIPLGGGATKPQKPLTEAQSKDQLFGTRMQEADKILTGMEAKGVTRPGGIKATAEATGRILGLGTDSFGGALADTFGTLTNWTQSPEQQSVDQARRDFLNAVLRKESGAAISPGEFTSAEKQYFPQANDSDTVIEQKKRARQLAIEGVLAGVPGGSRVKVPASDATKPKASGWSIQKVSN